jgi:SAM-dependent methyltransferase
MRILDVGCGPRSKIEGSIGLDVRPAPHVDVVHNLNTYPYPFPDDAFDRIEASHIIEHVESPLNFMNELHRIGTEGSIIRIITPHYSSQLSYGDLEHRYHFGYITFRCLQNTGLFTIEKHKLHFTDFYRATGVSLLANAFPRRWEKYMAWTFPALFVEVLLRVNKSGCSKDRLMEKYMY